jgi:cell wall-associated NlpC family hydrolase
VLAFARAQVGEPYQWGADGPDAWDCSGLTMRAWQ